MSLRFQRTLKDSDILRAQQNTHTLWGDGLPLDTRLEKLRKLMSYEGLLSFSGLFNDTGDMLCSMKWYSFDIRFKNRPIRSVGFGAIFTPEPLRGKGYAKFMIQEAMKEAKAQGYEAALLFSDIDPAYYTQFGFFLVDSSKLVVPVAELPRYEGDLKTRLAMEKDVQALRSFFTSSFPDDFVHMGRVGAQWDFFREKNGPSNDYILSQNGEDLGYVSFHEEEGETFLDEFAFKPELRQTSLALLGSFLSEKPFQTVTTWKHPSFLGKIPGHLSRRPKAVSMLATLSDRLEFPSNLDQYWFGPLDQY